MFTKPFSLTIFYLFTFISSLSINGQPLNCPNATIIGDTYYDVQANYGNPGRLIYEWPDFTMAAVWNLGFITPIFPDRGTGYNYFNGISWDVPPTTRLETLRTGFPNIVGSSNNHELIISHTPFNLIKLERNIGGFGPWNEEPLPMQEQLWPRFARGGTSGEIIHLLAHANSNFVNGQWYPLYYWRSLDNGISWDIQNFTIPHLDSNNTLLNYPNVNIACRGNIVAVLVGGLTDDLIL